VTHPALNIHNLNDLVRALASNEEAWQATRGLPEILPNASFPSDTMLWGTAATKDATTWTHIDDHGLATVVKVMTGRKYWVTMQRKGVRGAKETLGNMGTIDAFGPSSAWRPSSSCSNLWDHEGVVLEAGDTL